MDTVGLPTNTALSHNLIENQKQSQNLLFTNTTTDKNIMSTFYTISLSLSAFLCTVVFGKMLVFDTVIMPGISLLDDVSFLRAFQVIDGRIQSNEPVFVSVWVGSVISLLVTASCAILALIQADRLAVLLVSTVAWLVCNWTTFTINVPLNNRVKVLDLAKMDDMTAFMERQEFETPWRKWHRFRVVIFGMVSLALTSLLALSN